jgi:beta-aspartyl-peptidase (threonine type)
LAIHGGAGTIRKSQMTEEKEQAYKQALKESLQAGYNILAQGGTALDATQAAVQVMEDCPLFNAGKGAVFTNAATHELDASIMNGKTLEAGAVAGVRHVKNPIFAARAVMDKTQHVLLIGQGADNFAKHIGLDMVDQSYFSTEFRMKQLQQVQQEDTVALDHNVDPDKKCGTVGAVALDMHGNVAAATSTGGMTNKKFGRVGDSSIIGAGTYANNKTCAVSGTGHGEFFIRAVVGHDISALMEYKQLTLQQAADLVVMEKLPALGGDGGVVAVDAQGNVAMPFNTEGMYRGVVHADGTMNVAIYKE